MQLWVNGACTGSRLLASILFGVYVFFCAQQANGEIIHLTADSSMETYASSDSTYTSMPSGNYDQVNGQGIANDESVNVGLQIMADFEKLPCPKNFITKQASSYDRGGGGSDYGHFLNGDIGAETLTCCDSQTPPESTQCVMLDADGPGVVNRFWHTSLPGNSSKFRIYIDYSDTPIVATNRDEFFDRELLYPFTDLYVGNRYHSSGGYYCYFPIPFEQHIKITADSITDSLFWYNIGYSLFPDMAGITSFSGSPSSADEVLYNKILNLWHNLGTIPVDTSGAIRLGQIISLDASDSQEVVVPGPGTILSFKVENLLPADSLALRNVFLRIYWDGEDTASVEVPLGAFFGNWFEKAEFQSWVYRGGLLLLLPHALQRFCFDWVREQRGDGGFF